MKKQLVLGIMSGTSIDGVDYAVCSVSARRVELEEMWSVAFPKELEARLHAAARGALPSHQLAQLHHDLGRFYAQHAVKRGSRLKPMLAGLHGQTVFHNPRPPAVATLQLGEPAYLAARLGVPVVNNFRAADMAADGQGAPLATLFHVQAFGRPGEHVCVNNLGGISNVTSIDWRRSRNAMPAVLAFDTGPANLLIDHAMRLFTDGTECFDRNGAWAGKGEVANGLVNTWLRQSYFAQKPPKSTGRELFGEAYLAKRLAEMKRKGGSAYDMIATLTSFTARSLALNYQLHLPSPPDRVVLTGGGAANPVMREKIHGALATVHEGVSVVSSDELGWPVQSIEAAAFALLAWRRWHKLPGNLPGTTGAAREVLCGQITEW